MTISSIKNKLKHLSAEKPIRLAFYVFCFVTLIITSLSIPFYLENFWEFFGNILVEAHGLLFDLLVLGVFVLWLQRLGRQELTVTRYREEIQDYLGWDDERAMYQIVANIKRLNHYNITDITLSEAFLKNAYLVKAHLMKADLRRADLRQAYLMNADLTEANLIMANLMDADLTNANLTNADLTSADIRGTKLRANLSGAKLKMAIYDDMTKWPEDFDYEKAGAISSFLIVTDFKEGEH
jgi:BTB/POZ domain-containing protein KCTD9